MLRLAQHLEWLHYHHLLLQCVVEYFSYSHHQNILFGGLDVPWQYSKYWVSVFSCNLVFIKAKSNFEIIKWAYEIHSKLWMCWKFKSQQPKWRLWAETCSMQSYTAKIAPLDWHAKEVEAIYEVKCSLRR